jgi:NADPH2:quinone reductase
LIATALLVQGLTAYLLLERAHTKKDDVVLIAAAAGGVGSLAVQLAKARGATVIGLASASKFDLVKSLGADHVFDYGQADWSAKVSDVTRSYGVQVFLDSTGDLASWVFPLLGPFGRWIIYGVRRDQQNALPAEEIWSMIEKNISIGGFNLERHLQDVPRALADLFKSAIDGNLKVEIVKYPLADVSKVHSLLEQRKTTGKLLLIP